ncbi:M14 family zinc carboxypeptidase [Myroides sp. LJL119]
MDFNNITESFKDSNLKGRYITNDSLLKSLSDLKYYFKVDVVGYSQQNREIKMVSFGHGPQRIAMWSQMHGNESTTTKAVMDLLFFLNHAPLELVKVWQESFELKIVLILNPDGAKSYSRLNANQVDLNRDSVDRTQRESNVLYNFLNAFNPHWAFNLHDQRSIFGVGNTGKSAVVSFLAPCYNSHCEINESRQKAMQLIVQMQTELEKIIPGEIGRFDEKFNINCIGDYCQSLGIATILVEAGHSQEDYEREFTRKIVFRALLTGLDALLNKQYLGNTYSQYLHILENVNNFVDVIFTHVVERGTGEVFVVNIQYKEEFSGNKVNFCPIVVDINKKQSKFAHLLVEKPFFFKDDFVFRQNLLDRKLVDVVKISSEEVKILLKK